MKNRIKILGPLVAIAALLSLLTIGPASAAVTLTIAIENITPTTTVSNSAAGNNTVTVSVLDTDTAAATVSLTATVKNSTRNKSFTLTLTEATPGSTFYEGTFDVVTVATESLEALDLGANDGDVVQIIHDVFVKQITVDARNPTVAGLSPPDNTVTRAQAVTFTGTITDLGSGIPSASGNAPDSTNVTILVGPSGGPLVNRTSLATWTKVLSSTDSTKTIGFSFSVLLFLAEGEHDWQVEAADLVANTQVSDADGVSAGAQPNDLEIDSQPPSLTAAVTGDSWDATKGQIKENVRTSVMATFENTTSISADKLASGTLSISDFLVGDPGINPTAIVFPNLSPAASGNNTGTGPLRGGGPFESIEGTGLYPAGAETATNTNDTDLRNIVFLTLANDLSPDAGSSTATKLLVRVVGSIEDVASNVTTAGQVNATDGIAPKLTVTVTGETTTGRALAKKEVTVRVVSDETIAAGVLPIITVNLLEAVGSGTVTSVTNATTTPFATTEKVVSGLANTFEAVVKFTDVGSVEGLYHVQAEVDDAVGNTGRGGQSTDLDKNAASAAAVVDLSTGKAVLFEFDDEINNGSTPTFTLTPNLGGTKTDQTESDSPFIRIDLDGEGVEYALSASATLDKVKGVDVATDVEIDSHNAITLTTVTLEDPNGVITDVSGDVGAVSGDSNSFQLSTSGLIDGIHILKVNGVDDLGNTYSTDQKLTFTKVARAKYKIALVPGNNFVSLPGDPSDPSIDNVLAATDITQVLSYQNGVWLLAVKNTATGLYESADGLVQINAKWGFWMTSTTFAPIQVSIPERDFNVLPPTINVSAGWNMVPVVDAGLRAAGTGIDEDSYFGSLVNATGGPAWSVAYSFDTTNNAWVKALPGGATTNVEIGKGYWLWSTIAATLVP